ncbi:membrane protein [Clostridiales bacterium PH28_bin88]|nr:membrane protein [Clostridiales bacterium PH28_bin88]
MVFAAFLIILLLLLASGIHIGVGLGLTAVGLLFFFQGIPLEVITQTAFKSVNSYALAAIPFFILSGDLIMGGKMGYRVVDLTGVFLRRIHGGLAVAVMIVSIFFGAVSGSSVASAAALGRNTVDLLSGEGYPKRFVAGLVAVGGTLGLMIPPSLTFILIGTMQGIPIITLFTAGIVPGVLEGTILAVVTWYLCRRNGWGNTSSIPVTVKEITPKVKASLGILLMPAVILGGIYGGFFTPTEVSAVAAAYAFIVVVLIYRVVRAREVIPILYRSLMASGMIYFIVIGGNLTAFMLTRLGVTDSFVQLVTGVGMQPWQFLLMINLILLVLGMLLDGISVIILTVPIFFPAAMALGIDPIHLGVILTANVEIATLTPPVGLNLFVMSGVSGLPVDQVARGVGPFYLVRLAVLMVITYVPALSLWLV